MGVAEGVKNVFEGVVGAPVVVDHDAAFELGHGRAGLARAIEGESQARRGVQPTQLARDPIAGLVEMANRGLGHAPANGLVDGAQLLRLLSHPGDEAGRTNQWRAEQSFSACAARSSGISCWTLR